MSRSILNFYRLQAPDSEGRMLADYWRWDHDTLERRHDFIQWMFPLDEPSAFNPDAPILTEADRAAFRADSALQAALRRSLELFLNFLGLERRADGAVAPADNFQRRVSLWRNQNHNWLRITRMLKSLRLLGLEDEAAQVWKCLKMLHDQRGYVSADSFAYWADAAARLD